MPHSHETPLRWEPLHAHALLAISGSLAASASERTPRRFWKRPAMRRVTCRMHARNGLIAAMSAFILESLLILFLGLGSGGSPFKAVVAVVEEIITSGCNESSLQLRTLCCTSVQLLRHARSFTLGLRAHPACGEGHIQGRHIPAVWCEEAHRRPVREYRVPGLGTSRRARCEALQPDSVLWIDYRGRRCIHGTGRAQTRGCGEKKHDDHLIPCGLREDSDKS